MRYTDISKLANGKWRYILAALGVSDNFLKNRGGPCPFCGGKDRFRFDDKNGNGTFICNQCGTGNGVEFVKRIKGCDFVEAVRIIRAVLPDCPANPVQPKNPEKKKMRDVFDSTMSFYKSCKAVETGDPVYRYLFNRLGIETEIPHDIKYHSGGQQHFIKNPAMVSLIRDKNGIPCSIQYLLLTETGEKAPVDNPRRLARLPIPDSSACTFGHPSSSLGIAEGIETALAASTVSSCPVWAALDAGKLEKWSPPECVKDVFIYADNDLNGRGQQAGWNLYCRLYKAGYNVFMMLPPKPSTDWCDFVLETRNQD